MCPDVSIAEPEITKSVNLKHAFINNDEELEIFLNNPEYRNSVEYIRIYISKCDWLKKYSFPALTHIGFYDCKLQNILKILPFLKAPSLNRLGLVGQTFKGPYPEKDITMPKVTDLYINGPIEDLELFSVLKFPTLDSLSIGRHSAVKSFKGIEHIAPTLRSLEVVRIDFENFEGHGLEATFPLLNAIALQTVKNLDFLKIFKGFNAPQLETLDLSGYDLGNSNVFEGLSQMQAPNLKTVILSFSPPLLMDNVRRNSARGLSMSLMEHFGPSVNVETDLD
ncbi:MAG: hypothetical protein BGO07_01960 [Alphaproteobacteria bacterium 40-19]|nr:MAG: hypothetical protein BGO07_01960 [Alphaproteobacteria bacterium 40-19]